MGNSSFRYFSFESFINKLVGIPFESYHVIIISLILLGTFCNYNSDQSLPRFWLLVAGFAFIIYVDIYSIKQTLNFCRKMADSLSGDSVLYTARLKLMKRIYHNNNWIFVLIAPALIVPVVIYIIKFPLGLPIKIFAFTALYFIISLCLISYMQYVYLIMLTYDLASEAEQIEKYDRSRPHKTEWIIKLAALTNKQSNMFFLVGASFIGLLYLITFSGLYGVEIQAKTSRLIVIYLWMIIAVAIVIMFPLFSVRSYFSIKLLISKLVEKSINECNITQQMLIREKKKKRRQVLLQLNDIKILMLEKTPVYPQKPLVSYAGSYIIAIINFAATIEAAFSLIQYLP
jgi:hypothetical protein